jgi:hypothetical protein
MRRVLVWAFLLLMGAAHGQCLVVQSEGALAEGRMEWGQTRGFLTLADGSVRTLPRKQVLLVLPSTADDVWRCAFEECRAGDLVRALDRLWPTVPEAKALEWPLERVHLVGRLACALARGDILALLAKKSFPAVISPLALDLFHWRMELLLLNGGARTAAAELVLVPQSKAWAALDDEERAAMEQLTARALSSAGASDEARRIMDGLLTKAQQDNWSSERLLDLFTDNCRLSVGEAAKAKARAQLAALRTPKALMLGDLLQAEAHLSAGRAEDALALLSWRQCEGPVSLQFKLGLARARWTLGMAGDEMRLAASRSLLCTLARLGEDPLTAAAARRLLSGRF